MADLPGAGWDGCLVQTAEKFGEVAVARLRRRGLEGAAKRGGDAGMGGRNIHSDDSVIHGVQFRCRNLFSLQFHLADQRVDGQGSFLSRRFAAIGSPI